MMLIVPAANSYEQLVSDFVWDFPQQLNIADLICDRHARATPLAAAIIEDNGEQIRRYSFADLKRLSDNLAVNLHALGIERGDRVVIILGQNVEALIAHLAIFKLAAISVPIASLFSGNGLSFRIDDCQPKMIITDGDGAESIAELSLPSVENIAVISQSASGGQLDFEQLLSGNNPEFIAEITRAKDPALIFYSSGTTGMPKGAIHGHRIVNAHLPCFQLGYEMAPQFADVFWTASDWSWLGSLGDIVFPALYFGHPLIASPGRFSVARAYQIMDKHAVTCPYLATAVLRKMRSEAAPSGYNFKIRAIMTGGEALAPEVLNWTIKTFQAPVNDEFGLTESNQTCVGCTSLYKTPAGSVGRITPGKRVSIVDGWGKHLPEGELGEIAIWFDDPSNMLEYWRQPQKTHDKLVDGWFLSGDQGRVDQRGFLYYHGRLDDLILVNGLRVGPDEIEAQLTAHQLVAEAGVIGVPDAKSGESILAFVRLRPGVIGDSNLIAELKSLVKGQLAAHCYPKEIRFVEELPVTSTGKIRRAELRKQHA